MDLTVVLNLVLSITIVVLGIKRYLQSEVKAFVFIGLGFLMFALSHVCVLMGWLSFKTALAVVRIAGYIFVIIGLVL
jgi:hypothetical protein